MARKGTARHKRASRRRSAAPRKRQPEARLRLVGEDEKLERLVGELGNNRVARLLAVSRSQPSRWRAGREGIGPESRRRLVDLEYVWTRLTQLYPKEQAQIWLESPNAHLGARPVDVLALRGALPVIQAIDAEAEGAFA